jgi:hypothetical protein
LGYDGGGHKGNDPGLEAESVIRPDLPRVPVCAPVQQVEVDPLVLQALQAVLAGPHAGPRWPRATLCSAAPSAYISGGVDSGSILLSGNEQFGKE